MVAAVDGEADCFDGVLDVGKSRLFDVRAVGTSVKEAKDGAIVTGFGVEEDARFCGGYGSSRSISLAGLECRFCGVGDGEDVVDKRIVFFLIDFGFGVPVVHGIIPVGVVVPRIEAEYCAGAASLLVVGLLTVLLVVVGGLVVVIVVMLTVGRLVVIVLAVVWSLALLVLDSVVVFVPTLCVVTWAVVGVFVVLAGR